MSGFLVLARGHVVRAKMPSTSASIDQVLNGPATRLSAPMPDNVAVYCSAEAMAERAEPELLATLFCRKHGVIARDETVFGWVVIACDENHGFELGAPRWVMRDLVELHAAALAFAYVEGRDSAPELARLHEAMKPTEWSN